MNDLRLGVTTGKSEFKFFIIRSLTIIRLHLESYTPGTCRYVTVPVRTDLYRPVLCYRMYRYVLLGKCRMTVQVGTYRYVLVQENVQKYVRVRT